MAVDKMIIEAHSNPEGLYQLRWQVRGVEDGINDDALDLTLADALLEATETVRQLKERFGIRIKPKNIIVHVPSVKKLAERDYTSGMWLNDNGFRE